MGIKGLVFSANFQPLPNARIVVMGSEKDIKTTRWAAMPTKIYNNFFMPTLLCTFC